MNKQPYFDPYRETMSPEEFKEFQRIERDYKTKVLNQPKVFRAYEVVLHFFNDQLDLMEDDRDVVEIENCITAVVELLPEHPPKTKHDTIAFNGIKDAILELTGKNFDTLLDPTADMGIESFDTVVRKRKKERPSSDVGPVAVVPRPRPVRRVQIEEPLPPEPDNKIRSLVVKTGDRIIQLGKWVQNRARAA